MGLKPIATYGEKDAKAPSGGIDTKLVETFFLILLSFNYGFSWHVYCPPIPTLCVGMVLGPHKKFLKNKYTLFS